MNVKELAKNGLGRDFFVGDLHGCYGRLKKALAEVNFDEKVDRLICVGDLIDRGIGNVECIRLLKEPWFFSVKGNHEQLMLTSLNGSGRERKISDHIWRQNGGDWWMRCDPNDKADILTDYIKIMDNLPDVIKIGEIYVLHAEFFGDINDVFGTLSPRREEELVWGRSRINYMDTTPVENCEMVVVGHTPVKRPIALGNTVYIDLGVCFNDETQFKLFTADELRVVVENGLG